MTDVAIIGAGAIGLAIAWRLLEQGARVTVYERDTLGHGATWASAGLLAPTAGHGGPAGSALDAFCRDGAALWPTFADELQRLTGHDIGRRTEGTLVVALNDTEATPLRATFEAWRAAGDDAQAWLDASDVARLEPALAGRVIAARFCPGDHQIDARRLALALAAAVRALGGIIREHTVVAPESLGADVVILAAGAWTPGVTVRPLKGQMIALADTSLRHVVFTRDAYLVPRGDRLLIGATVEDVGFDVTVTDDAIATLRSAAERAMPSLGAARLLDAWAGLRPVTPSGAPLLGRLDARTIVATGHGRNGILLTPITAARVAELVLGSDSGV